MDFKEIFENFKTILTEKYFCFEGRAGRAEFWQFILSVFVIYIVLSLVSNILA